MDFRKDRSAYARVIAENPNRKGMLFAGTGNALYYSMDDGATWKQFKDGLPPSPVSWIVVQKNYHDLVVSTYGRGFYILEDLTPLEQPETGAEATVRFYEPRATYRLLRGGRALLNYSLKEPAKDAIKLEILDSHGNVIREMKESKGQAGLNRVSWDLHYEKPKLVELRTTPPAESAYLGRAALRENTDASHHALGAGAGRSRTHCRARQIHSAPDCGWTSLLAAARNSAAAHKSRLGCGSAKRP